MASELEEAVREAMEVVLAETGGDVEALFGERDIDRTPLSIRASHAAGVIEGAGVALGLTALELFDELRLLR